MPVMIEWWILLLASTLRITTPLLFAAMGGMVSERSGVINIALEGFMLAGAFTGAVVAFWAHSPLWGALAGALSGLGVAAVYGLFVIRLRSDQIVAGTAINFLCTGLPPFFSKVLFGSTTGTPGLDLSDRFVSEPMWAAWILVGVAYFWFYKTRSGLWVRFAGEHPAALAVAGVSVVRVRWAAVLVSGLLAALGGVSLSIFLSSSFSRNMTAGRGFMALAALILGKWKPLPTAAACVLFGMADALQIRLQGVVLWGKDPVPVQFIQMLPYVVTVLVLAGFVGQARPPKALGDRRSTFG